MASIELIKSNCLNCIDLFKPFHPTGPFLTPNLIILIINKCIFYILSVAFIALYVEQDVNFMEQICKK